MKYFITFSKGELEALRLFNEFDNIDLLVKGLKKSKSQVYRILQKLKSKNLFVNGQLKDLPYLKKLVLLVRKNKNLIGLFSDSALPILLQLRKPKMTYEIVNFLGVNEQTVYKIISKAREIGLVDVELKRYFINSKNWVEVLDFLNSLWEQEMSFDKRVPKNSVIYYKSEKEIIFSNSEEINATPAAFSAFEKYGVKFFPNTNYYVLPKQKVSAERIYSQAVKIIEKDFDYRLMILLGIFALKNKLDFNNWRVKEFNLLLAGKKIQGLPSPEEFKEKAKEYGVFL